MNTTKESHASIWMDRAPLPKFPALTANERADVCVVGAGIAGLTTAYLLTRAGKSVIVLEAGSIIAGETQRTTAHLVICPHLGGIVCWNHAEKTWDCPAHGSHFDRLGKVLHGPANQDLSPIEVHAH